jgi:hypothetical protein
VSDNIGKTIFWTEKERKSIGNHKRDDRTAEKHRETEATEKKEKNSKPVPGYLGVRREVTDALPREVNCWSGSESSEGYHQELHHGVYLLPEWPVGPDPRTPNHVRSISLLFSQGGELLGRVCMSGRSESTENWEQPLRTLHVCSQVALRASRPQPPHKQVNCWLGSWSIETRRQSN